MIKFIAGYEIEGVEKGTINELKDWLIDREEACLDIETMSKFPKGTYNEEVYKGGLDPYLSSVVMIQIGDDKNVFVVDVRDFTPTEIRSIFDVNTMITWVLFNGKFESKHLKHNYGVIFNSIYDVMLCEMNLTNGLQLGYSLEKVAARYLGTKSSTEVDLFTDYDPDEAYIDKSTRLGFIHIGDTKFTKEQVLYGAGDIEYPFRIKQFQMQGREGYNPQKLHDLENEFCLVLADMELKGITFDKEQWLEVEKTKKAEFKHRLDKLNRYIEQHYPQFCTSPDLFSPGRVCNIQWSSSKQVIEVFKASGGCPKEKSKETGKVEYTVGAKALTKLLTAPYKELFMKDKETEIISREDFILNYLLLKKSEQSITTFGAAFLKYVHPITGRLHSSYRQLMATGRISSNNPNCLSLDTEVLTRNGWKNYTDLKIGTEIVTSTESTELKFSPIKKLYNGEGECLHLENTNLTSICTKNHRIPTQDRKTKKYHTKTAETLQKDSHTFCAGILNEGLKEDLNFLSLLVAIQADGTITNSYAYDFKFSKERKSIRLKSILDSLGIKYKYTKTKATKTRKILYRYYFQPDTLLRIKVNKYLPNKIFSFLLLNLSLENRLHIVHETQFWDGSYTRRTNYPSAIEMNVDVIQALCSTCNIRARKRIYISSQGSVSHQLDLTYQNFKGTANIKIKNVGVQKVWCCEVESGYFLARRKHSTFITGNCQNLPNEDDYRKCFNAPSGFTLINSDMKSQEARCLADVSQDPDMVSFFNYGHPIHGENYHCFTATKMFQVIRNDPGLIITQEKNPEERQAAKIVGFKISFGGGAHTLKDDFGVEEEVAQQFIDGFFEGFPTLKKDFEDTQKKVLKQGYIDIDTIVGRRWFDKNFKKMNELSKKAWAFYPENYKDISSEEKIEVKNKIYKEHPELKKIWSEYFQLQGRLQRKALNYRIQGLAGSQTKMAAILIRRYILANNLQDDISITSIIHDEYIIEINIYKAEYYLPIIKDLIIKGAQMFSRTVKMDASACITPFWKH